MSDIDYSKYGVKEETPSVDYSKYGINVPRETSAGETVNFTQNLVRSLARRGLGDVATGLGSDIKGLYNLVTPKSMNSTRDVGAMFGINNPNATDKFVQGVAAYAPFEALTGGAAAIAPVLAASRGAKILSAAIPGGAFGATQAASEGKSIPQGTAIGAAANVAGAAIPEAAGASWEAIKNSFSKYAGKGLTGNINKAFEASKNMNNKEAFEVIKSRHLDVSADEGRAHQNAQNIAKAVDAQAPEAAPGYKTPSFDDSGYVKALQKRLDDMREKSRNQPGHALENEAAEKFLSDQITKAKHNTFSDALDHNKALNEYYRNEITPGKSVSFEAIKFAKSELKKSIEDNINKNNLQSTLGEAWNKANKITTDKQQTFNQIISPKGKESISSFKALSEQNNPNKSVGSFIKDYLPAKGEMGTEKMEQLSKMLGDRQAAKDLLKHNLFGKAFTDGEVDPGKFLSKYNAMSKEQQAYLFSDSDKRTVEALRNILKKYPDALNLGKKGPGFELIKHSLAGLLGIGAGHLLGVGEVAGALGGVAASQALQHGLSSIASKPSINKYFAKRLTEGSKKMPSSQASELKKRLLRSAITPGAVSAFGGQQQ